MDLQEIYRDDELSGAARYLSVLRKHYRYIVPGPQFGRAFAPKYPVSLFQELAHGDFGRKLTIPPAGVRCPFGYCSG
jgi:hypothetical protein